MLLFTDWYSIMPICVVITSDRTSWLRKAHLLDIRYTCVTEELVCHRLLQGWTQRINIIVQLLCLSDNILNNRHSFFAEPKYLSFAFQLAFNCFFHIWIQHSYSHVREFAVFLLPHLIAAWWHFNRLTVSKKTIQQCEWEKTEITIRLIDNSLMFAAYIYFYFCYCHFVFRCRRVVSATFSLYCVYTPAWRGRLGVLNVLFVADILKIFKKDWKAVGLIFKYKICIKSAKYTASC